MDKEEYMKIQEGRSGDGAYREMSPWAVTFFEKYSKYVEEPILEIGSGNGPVLEYLKRKGLFAIGVDISRPSVWHCLNHERPVPAIWQDAQDPLPFPDDSFKTVITFHTLEHLLYPEKTIKEISRVLKGTFCTINPITCNPTKEDKKEYGHFADFGDMESFKNLFKDYKILEMGEIHPGVLLIATNENLS